MLIRSDRLSGPTRLIGLVNLWMLIGLIGVGGACDATPPDGFTSHTIDFAGRIRSYIAYLPAHAGASRLPLVMVLHGQGGSGEQVLAQGHWRQAADQYQFALVAPDGVLEDPDRRPSFIGNRRSWNAGPSIGAPAERLGIDDVGFLRAVLDQVESDAEIDRTRIYVTGFSNGAAMAFRVAAEMPGRFAALAPVSNALLVPVSRTSPFPSLLLIWGTADPLDPFSGGEVRRAGKTYERPSADESLLAWGQALGCSKRGSEDLLAPGVVAKHLEDCSGDGEAELVAVAGLGHQWPGGTTYARMFAGPGSDALDATALIWRFLSKHRLAGDVHPEPH